MSIRERLTAALAAAAREAGAAAGDDAPGIRLDVPPTPESGDFASDVALTLARQSRQPAASVAAAIAARLRGSTDLVERVEAAPSGVLNIFLRAGWLDEMVRRAIREGAGFGRTNEPGQGRRAQVEFVSADPTGPLSVLHGRGAALGDAIANLLAWTGYEVSREFYINDLGGQADRAARDAVVSGHREVLSRLGVHFDTWYSERDQHQQGKIAEVVEVLRRRPDTVYEAEGAVWLRGTAFGDTEDRPLVRSNGHPTYYAGDLAYHLDKVRRGFKRIVDVWSANHAEYVIRTQAGMRALGSDPRLLEILLFQPVLLKVNDLLIDPAGSSGNNALLREVIEQAGAETTRFFYLLRPTNATLEFDLDLARNETRDNPYCFVRRVLDQARARLTGAGDADTDLSRLTQPAERALMRRVADFPDEVRAAAQEMEPNRLVRFAQETAAALGEVLELSPADAPATQSLVAACVSVLTNALAVLGIAPAENHR